MPAAGILRRFVAALVFGAAATVPALAGEARVAVAANFTAAAKEIAAAFRSKTGEDAVLSFGSTGQLYNQISQGAPFDVFLAADAKRPAMAVKGGQAVEGSEFTYAVGRIVLYSADPALVRGSGTLNAARFRKIAIANPKTAPYGAAAVETMKKIGVYDALRPKIVEGNNIAQTFQFVSSGNAELGFVALSEVAGREGGSRWVVPSGDYRPIRQDAVLLTGGADNEAATAFVAFLKGPEAARIMEKYGYAAGGTR